ncbi:MAG: dihydrofolate reductase [Clostridia bacterium]|nr:dihydrofolate reductase [Clostridia bacterium]
MRAILHADKNWGIGKSNSLMFSLPQDMKFFRETTSGKTVLMGENTLLSFPGGKPLKNRTNVVLSLNLERDDCIIVRSLDEAFEELKKSETDVYVIGGASVYRQMLPYCEEVLVTKVYEEGDADTFFPNLDEHEDFECVYQSEEIDDNSHKIRFTTYKNNNVKNI